MKNDKRVFGVKVVATVVMVFIVSLLSFFIDAAETNTSALKRRLIVVQGRVLNAYFEGQYREIKRAKIIYGSGWLDDHRVFVAYQREGTGEAVAELEVIDLRQSRTTKLTGFGGVGESHFDVNSSTGEVVYADSSGVKLLRIDAKTNSYKIDVIKKIDILKKDVYCYGAFWIDNKTVGCLNFVDVNKTNFVKFPVQKKSDKDKKR